MQKLPELYKQKKVLTKPVSPNSELAMPSPLLTVPSASSLVLNTNVSTITKSVGSNNSVASNNERAKPCQEKTSNEVMDTHGRRFLETVNDISIDTLGNNSNGTQSGRCVQLTTQYGRDDVDELMIRAFGEPLVHSSGEDVANAWFQRWKTVVGLQGKQYNLPGGAVGCQYVDLLSEEVAYLSSGNFSSDRLIVFSASMLQRDRMISKTVDIRGVLERRMRMWKDEEFDLLLQEAVRCDKPLRNSRKGEVDKEHIVKVFATLMLNGKVRAAIRWLSESGRGRVLQASDLV